MFREFERDNCFTKLSSKRSLFLCQRLVPVEKLREVSVSSVFRADNYAVARRYY